MLAVQPADADRLTVGRGDRALLKQEVQVGEHHLQRVGVGGVDSSQRRGVTAQEIGAELARELER